MNRPYALIMAGGRGDRLGGVRKAELKIGGRKLIERVLDALQSVSEPILLSTGDLDRAWPGLALVPDLDAPLRGPLAGIAAAVDHLARRGINNGLMVTAAVDTPFLPPDFVPVMEQALGTRNAAYAHWGESFYPTSAIWRLEALQQLPADVVADKSSGSAKALLQELDALAVDWSERQPNPFVNINTIEDVIALGRLAGA